MPEQLLLDVGEDLAAALSRQARQSGVTINTLIQAAWGILLGRLTGRDDVVFGITVSGRPPDVSGIESMLGLFINTVLLRLMVAPGERLRLRLDYRTDLFGDTQMQAIGNRLVRLLEAMIANPRDAIGRFDVLAAAERLTILRDWNDTTHPIPPGTVADLFANQVAWNPDAVAAICAGRTLTYGDLDARANQ